MCSNYRGISLLVTAGKVLNRIILEKLKEALDNQLREQQAGFQQHISCSDHSGSLGIEWNFLLYINFVDFEKAFDSIDRNTLWPVIRHRGITEKLTNIIQCQYKSSMCRVIHRGGLTEAFEVKTGTRRGCMLSPFLFLLVINWITKQSMDSKRTGIRLLSGKSLDDLEFICSITVSLFQPHAGDEPVFGGH